MEKTQKKKIKSRVRQRKLRRTLGSRMYKNYSEDMLRLACEAVETHQISSRDAERQFSIPRRTILNKIKNKHQNPVGHPTALTPVEEMKILKVLQVSGDFGSPLTKMDLKLLVHEYLKKNSRSHIFKDRIPGDAWVNGFLARHADCLTVRTTQNISKARAEKGPQEIAEYFENLGTTLKDIPAENIINLDETNLSDDPGSSKGIFRRGIKYPERVVNSTKGNISLMFTATAGGKCLPLYVVYKAENLYSEWVSGGPPETRYNCTKSGWFDSAMFEDYFEKIIVPWAQNTPGTKVVICDNLSSHLSVKVIELCEQNNIHFVFIPPRSTHLTQPLDIAFYAPLKKAWRKILYQYKLRNPNQASLNKKHFPKLLHELISEIQLKESQIIKSGFRASGIYPFNPQQVLKKLPEIQEEILSYGIDQTLLEYLKETRAPKPMQVRRNKKVNCEPGKSVTVSDFNNADSCRVAPCDKNKTKYISSRKIKVQNKKETIFLDEHTGLFTTLNLHNETKRNIDSYLENDLECIYIIDKHSSPESLKKLCTDSINANLGLSLVHNARSLSTTTNISNLPEHSAISSFKKTGQPKIKILSDVIIKAGRPSAGVTILKEISNKIENTSFATANKNDLPECLKKNEPNVLKKQEYSKKKKRGNRKIKVKNVLRQSKLKRGLTKSCTSVERGNKGPDSESSSMSADTEFNIMESDESNYETLEDYIAECLKEQEEKENIELQDTSFGLHDIEFYTESHEKLKAKDWILAQFATKKCAKHYVGEVLSINNKSCPTVKFLRKVKEAKTDKGTTFTYPIVDDICTMEHIEDIITVLPQPKIARRGHIVFNVDFNSFNIQ